MCPSLDERIKTKCIYIMEYYSAIKKRNPAICDNMDGPWAYYTKWNKLEKGRYYMNSLPVESKKKSKS